MLFTERGDERGAIDDALEAIGLQRRIVLTVPQASLVSHVLKTTDLVSTVGRRLADRLEQDGLQTIELPFATNRWRMSMISEARRAGDQGVLWLRGLIGGVFAQAHKV